MRPDLTLSLEDCDATGCCCRCRHHCRRARFHTTPGFSQRRRKAFRARVKARKRVSLQRQAFAALSAGERRCCATSACIRATVVLHDTTVVCCGVYIYQCARIAVQLYTRISLDLYVLHQVQYTLFPRICAYVLPLVCVYILLLMFMFCVYILLLVCRRSSYWCIMCVYFCLYARVSFYLYA